MSREPDANPYQSPGSESRERDSPSVGQFRWRVIPTALVYIYGGCALVCGFIGCTFSVFWLVAGRFVFPQRDVPPGLTLAVGVLALIAGGIWIVAARAWWRKRYWRACAATALGFLPHSLTVHLLVTFLP